MYSTDTESDDETVAIIDLNYISNPYISLYHMCNKMSCIHFNISGNNEDSSPGFEERPYSIGGRSLSTETEYAWNKTTRAPLRARLLPAIPGQRQQQQLQQNRARDSRSSSYDKISLNSQQNVNQITISGPRGIRNGTPSVPIGNSYNPIGGGGGGSLAFASGKRENRREGRRTLWEAIAGFVCSLGWFGRRKPTVV